MTGALPRVLLLVLDGLPARHVGPRLTPALAALAAGGGWQRAGGVAVSPTCTYPNHATLVTGVGPDRHGIWANRVPVEGTVRPARELGPTGPTLFDACRAGGRTTAAVLGDQHLVGVMAADRADTHWPPAGALPAGTAVDDYGYAADRAVLAELTAVAGWAPDLLVGHLNEPDTAGHRHGPDSEAAAQAYRGTDDALGVLLDALRPQWERWVVIVVSDHDQETVVDAAPVDLAAAARTAGVEVTVVPEGNAALLAGAGAADGRWLEGMDGLEGHRAVAPGLRLAWTAPGRVVGTGASALCGVHGGPRQAAQVAVCGGGHPAAGPLAAALARRRPGAADWAPTVAALLGLGPAVGTGRSLVARS